jgi:CRISPR-associated protein Csb2
MLTLRIEYVTGRSVATEYNARDFAEWPPHPARVFSALVATWAADEDPCPAERSALEWLEMAGAPALAAAPATHRDLLPFYVPDNPTSVINQRVVDAFAVASANLDEARRAVVPSEGSSASAKRLRSAEQAMRKAANSLVAELGPMSNPTDQDLNRARAIAVPRNARQERRFPSVTPTDSMVYLVWGTDPSEAHRTALSELARRVVRIGHSSSLVRCTFDDRAPEPNWLPDDEEGDVVLRVAGPGQLARLEQEFERHQETEPRILPCLFQRYRRERGARDESIAESVFGRDWLVFRRIGGPRLPLTRVVDVAQALRGALIGHAAQPPPEILTGHDAAGRPLSSPHVAFVPLPFVGHRHSDGAILGVAVVLPKAINHEERMSVFAAVARWEEEHRQDEEETPIVPLQLGAAGVLELERAAWGELPLSTLRPTTWSRPARTWLSVTPVALDRNPGDLYASDPSKAESAYREAAETVARSCENIGLPRPEWVEVLPSATALGTAKAQQFPPFPRDASKGRRVKVHTCVRFERPVMGPVLLGAGRYTGLGLFRPIGEENDSDGRPRT